MNALLEQLRTLRASAETAFARLNQRERLAVSGASAVAVLLFLFVVFFTLGNTAANTRQHTTQKLQKLEQAEALAATYREAQSAREEAENQLRMSNVSLVSYVEDKGVVAHLEIPAMTPKGDSPLGDGKIIQSSVEMTLADIKLGQLVEFLTGVEKGPGVVKVTSLRLEPHVANENLSAFTTISTYRLKE